MTHQKPAINIVAIIKSNLSLYSLYYAEACNEFAGGLICVIALVQYTVARFGEMFQRWQAVGNIVSDLTGQRFEPQV